MQEEKAKAEKKYQEILQEEKAKAEKEYQEKRKKEETFLLLLKKFDVPKSVSFVDTEGDTSTLRLDTATQQLSWHTGGRCYLQNISILEFDASRAAIIAPEHFALTARLVDPPAGVERDSLLRSIAAMARSVNAVQLRGFKEISDFSVE